eukprot:3336937-Prymnesium_polylepis.1
MRTFGQLAPLAPLAPLFTGQATSLHAHKSHKLFDKQVSCVRIVKNTQRDVLASTNPTCLGHPPCSPPHHRRPRRRPRHHPHRPPRLRGPHHRRPRRRPRHHPCRRPLSSSFLHQLLCFSSVACLWKDASSIIASISVAKMYGMTPHGSQSIRNGFSQSFSR